MDLQIGCISLLKGNQNQDQANFQKGVKSAIKSRNNSKRKS